MLDFHLTKPSKNLKIAYIYKNKNLFKEKVSQINKNQLQTSKGGISNTFSINKSDLGPFQTPLTQSEKISNLKIHAYALRKKLDQEKVPSNEQKTT